MKNEKNISMFEGSKFGISMDKFFEMGGGFQPVNQTDIRIVVKIKPGKDIYEVL